MSANEFETLIDGEGRIFIPKILLDEFVHQKVQVRISKQEIAAKLTARGVTEAEIERISSLQRESREQVVNFLLSEGTMKKPTFVRRAKGKQR